MVSGSVKTDNNILFSFGEEDLIVRDSDNNVLTGTSNLGKYY
jgi:hypothetical protein